MYLADCAAPRLWTGLDQLVSLLQSTCLAIPVRDRNVLWHSLPPRRTAATSGAAGQMARGWSLGDRGNQSSIPFIASACGEGSYRAGLDPSVRSVRSQIQSFPNSPRAFPQYGVAR